MGHIRLTTLPRTQRWTEVVALLDQGASVDEVAEATFWAAYAGLDRVPKDAGFTQTLTSIFKFIDSLQAKDPVAGLRKNGFTVSPDASLIDFVSGFQEHAARAAADVRARSDLAQIAQESFSKVLIDSAGSSMQTLFGVQTGDVAKALKSTLKGQQLGRTMHEFFVGFTQHYLNYYLGRALPAHVGVGKALANVDRHSEFGRSFDLFVRQTVRITDEFSPGWFGKAKWEGRLTHIEVAKFAHTAFKKIRSEFKRGAKSSG